MMMTVPTRRGRWRHAIAIIAMPGTVAVLGPALLLAGRGPRFAWGLSGAGAVGAWLLGLALMAGGLALWAWTVLLFASDGQGTLAPWDPPSRLVINGPYRHVRNPMITGVVALLLGASTLFGRPSLIVYVAVIAALNHAYFILIEEPGLLERFGPDYGRYKEKVPRWIPRRTPYS